MSCTRKPTQPGGDYVVGYGRPPATSRFKPGQSGNPKGRPRKSQDLGSILQRVLDSRVSIQENDRRRRITIREAIVRGLVTDAARREPKELRMLFALMARHQAAPDAARDTASLAAEDQAILADFLARNSATANDVDASQRDGQSAGQGTADEAGGAPNKESETS
jgi:hypothetical protein